MLSEVNVAAVVILFHLPATELVCSLPWEIAGITQRCDMRSVDKAGLTNPRPNL